MATEIPNQAGSVFRDIQCRLRVPDLQKEGLQKEDQRNTAAWVFAAV